MKPISRKKELLDQLLREEIVDVVLQLIKLDQPVTMDEVARKCGGRERDSLQLFPE